MQIERLMELAWQEVLGNLCRMQQAEKMTMRLQRPFNSLHHS